MHTPGPWLFSPVNDCAIAIVEDDGTSIFDATVGLHTTGQSVLAANVNLICSAPELLDALRRVMRHIPETAGGASLSDDMYRARAAIARATGGQ